MVDRKSFEQYIAQSATIGLTRGAFSHLYAALINWEFFLQRNHLCTSHTFFTTTPLNKMMVGTTSIFWRNSREFFRGWGWETGKGSFDTALRLCVADCVFNGLMDGTGLTQITKGQGFLQSLSSFFGNKAAVTKLSRNIGIAGIHSYIYWDTFIRSGLYYDKFLRTRFGRGNDKTNYFVKCLLVGGTTTLVVIPLNHFKNLYMAGQFGQTSLVTAGKIHMSNLLHTCNERGFLAAIQHGCRGGIPYGIANLMTFGTVEAGRRLRKYLENTEAARGG